MDTYGTEKLTEEDEKTCTKAQVLANVGENFLSSSQ